MHARWTMLRGVARQLEGGRWDGPLARTLAAVWAPIATSGLVRPARVPNGTAVVCVGGATLGGSGKTPVAIACARALADAGATAVLVGHAYRAAPRCPRVVGPDDPVELVGDEALVCARALSSSKHVTVVVAPTRQAAIDAADASFSSRPGVIVLDGPLRIRGGTRIRSLLALDADEPWGSGRLPPSGDLRAPREALVACADHVVMVDSTPTSVRFPNDGRGAPLASLRGAEIGVFTALARPGRLLRALRRAGLTVREVVSIADHGPLTPEARSRLSSGSVDLWIASEKCALHLAAAPLKSQLGVLRSEVVLPERVLRSILELVPPAAPRPIRVSQNPLHGQP